MLLFTESGKSVKICAHILPSLKGKEFAVLSLLSEKILRNRSVAGNSHRNISAEVVLDWYFYFPDSNCSFFGVGISTE